MTYSAPTPPAPYAPSCDICGSTPALLIPTFDAPMCPACAARHALLETAEDHLWQSGGEVIAAWAHHWQRAGLTLDQLRGSLHGFTDRLGGGVGYFDGTPAERRVQVLQGLMADHPMPTYAPVKPRRWIVEDPLYAHGIEEAHHSFYLLCSSNTDGEEVRVSLPQGLPASATRLPNGDVMLTFLPPSGYVSDTFYIPADHAPRILALLGFDGTAGPSA